MTDPRDDLIDTQRKLIAAYERYIAILQASLTACQQAKGHPAPKAERKDMQA